MFGRDTFDLLSENKKRMNMFGLKPSIEVDPSLSIQRTTRPEAAPVKLLLDDNELKAHIRTEEALKFCSPARLHAELIDFLNRENIKVFDKDKVHAYLKGKAEAEKKVYIWRSLRPQDKTTDYRLYTIEGHGGYDSRDWESRPYDKPVPLRVLVTVEKIYKKFGDKIQFLVSDYEVPHPDPFIMVTALDLPRIVFDVWDEPSFKG
ncbi:MAG: hypothetical protein A3H69_05885 [Candidatus Sungbacteria bacterium RIFCSPLOWO2_02_FULL_47_9]|nr:MAG: hypothetical protein A3H69_05885 [Candidatus Sungbacteria bacterium RIFCSPLOWO2_02_FULL_47_9]